MLNDWLDDPPVKRSENSSRKYVRIEANEGAGFQREIPFVYEYKLKRRVRGRLRRVVQSLPLDFSFFPQRLVAHVRLIAHGIRMYIDPDERKELKIRDRAETKCWACCSKMESTGQSRSEQLPIIPPPRDWNIYNL